MLDAKKQCRRKDENCIYPMTPSEFLILKLDYPTKLHNSVILLLARYLLMDKFQSVLHGV